MSAADRIALIDITLGENLKEWAWLYVRMGQYRHAIRALDVYLKALPKAQDAEEIRSHMQELWTILAHLN